MQTAVLSKSEFKSEKKRAIFYAHLYHKAAFFFLLAANLCWIVLTAITIVLFAMAYHLNVASISRLLLLFFPAVIGLCSIIYFRLWFVQIVALSWLVSGLVFSLLAGLNSILVLVVFIAAPIATLGYGNIRLSIEIALITIFTVLVLGFLATFSTFAPFFLGDMPEIMHQNVTNLIFFFSLCGFFLFNILALKNMHASGQVRGWHLDPSLASTKKKKKDENKNQVFMLLDKKGTVIHIAPQAMNFFLESLVFVFGETQQAKKIKSLQERLNQKNNITGTEKEVGQFVQKLLEKYGKGFHAVYDDIKQNCLTEQRKTYLFVMQKERALPFKAMLKKENETGYRVTFERQKDISWLLAERDQALVKAKSNTEYLANMSHELRTPLNAIIGFSEIMKTRLFGPIPDKYSDYIDMTYTSSRHLLDLIGDILDLSKIEANKYILNYEIFDIKILAESCSGMMRSSAKDKKIKLIADHEKDSLEISADRTACRQIILNLLSNAIKYTPENGEVHIDIQRQGEKIDIKVRDTGLGMSEEEIARIGSPYEQAESHAASGERSSGLGLSLVRELILMHKGAFKIKSKKGHGTEIILTIPVSEPKI